MGVGLQRSRALSWNLAPIAIGVGFGIWPQWPGLLSRLWLESGLGVALL